MWFIIIYFHFLPESVTEPKYFSFFNRNILQLCLFQFLLNFCRISIFSRGYLEERLFCFIVHKQYWAAPWSWSDILILILMFWKNHAFIPLFLPVVVISSLLSSFWIWANTFSAKLMEKKISSKKKKKKIHAPLRLFPLNLSLPPIS